MKLKLTIMSALFAAGVFASFALAEGGNHAKKADNNNCQEVNISGTIAPQTLAVTVDKASKKTGIAAGTQLSLAVGAAGQTVRVKVEACVTGTPGTSAGVQYSVYSVRQVELKVKTTATGTTTTGATTTGATTTGATTTSKKHDDEQHGNNDGDHHQKGGTTTTTRR
jgi:hypothetical protein